MPGINPVVDDSKDLNWVHSLWTNAVWLKIWQRWIVQTITQIRLIPWKRQTDKSFEHFFSALTIICPYAQTWSKTAASEKNIFLLRTFFWILLWRLYQLTCFNWIRRHSFLLVNYLILFVIVGCPSSDSVGSRRMDGATLTSPGTRGLRHRLKSILRSVEKESSTLNEYTLTSFNKNNILLT